MVTFFRELSDKQDEWFDRMMETQRPKLKPPKNMRYARPRVCGTCKFIIYDGLGYSECLRPDGQGWNSSDLEQWFWKCDRWTEEGGA